MIIVMRSAKKTSVEAVLLLSAVVGLLLVAGCKDEPRTRRDGHPRTVLLKNRKGAFALTLDADRKVTVEKDVFVISHPETPIVLGLSCHSTDDRAENCMFETYSRLIAWKKAEMPESGGRMTVNYTLFNIGQWKGFQVYPIGERHYWLLCKGCYHLTVGLNAKLDDRTEKTVMAILNSIDIKSPVIKWRNGNNTVEFDARGRRWSFTLPAENDFKLDDDLISIDINDRRHFIMRIISVEVPPVETYVSSLIAATEKDFRIKCRYRETKNIGIWNAAIYSDVETGSDRLLLAVRDDFIIFCAVGAKDELLCFTGDELALLSDILTSLTISAKIGDPPKTPGN